MELNQGQEPESNGENAQDAGAPKVFDETYVKKLREEAASWRTKAQAAEGKVTEFEKAQMTEAERLKAEAETVKQQLEQARVEARQARAKAAIAQHAVAAGLDVGLAEKLIDVQFDDGGQPTGIEAAIADLLGKHPHLKAGFGGGATNPQRQSGLTVEEIKRMTPDQVQARWKEVEAALASQ